MFRPSRLLAVLLLASPAAFAQPAPDGGPPPPPPSNEAPQAPPPGHMSGKAKFEAANITHDGRLTPDQAQAGGLRAIAKHFAEIDVDRKGYVTWQDIRTWKHAKRAAKRAQPTQAPPQ
jgi:hypothetical protein